MESLFYLASFVFVILIAVGIMKEKKPQQYLIQKQVIVVSDERYHRASQIIEMLKQYPDDHTKTMVLMEMLPKQQSQPMLSEQSLNRSLDFVDRVANIVNKKQTLRII